MNTSLHTIKEALYLVLHQIPEGRFTTYGRLAELIPMATSARQVARLLSQLPEGTQLPWHRVVNSQFKVSQFGKCDEQAQRLRSEGLLISSAGKLPADKVWPDTP